MIYLYIPFALLLIYFSIKSLLSGLAYLNYFKDELAKKRTGYDPFVTVIAPCKGIDDGLAANLKAVVEQNYEGYEVLFVADDPDDPAVGVVNEVSRESTTATKLIVAPKATMCGQKAANLREAVLHVDRRCEVLVFVDSDVRPARDWLTTLVAPLENVNVGAATGYRWFVPCRDSIAGEVRSAWNASIASALGPNTHSNFCWGGSTAIRRDVFERLNIRERWKGALSDDFAVTRAMNGAGLPIVFVPQAIVASSGGTTWRELLEFTNRQMKITRVYAPKLWIMSLVGSGLFTVVMLASLLILSLAPFGSYGSTAAIFTLVSVTALSVGKAWLRFKAIRMVLPEENGALERQFPFQLTFWLIAQPLFLINSLAALFSRRIRWRGTEYEMVSHRETRVL